MARTYAQLSLEDRCEFARLLANGGLVRRIAAALDRSPSGPTAPSDAFVGSVSTAPTARWLRLALHPCVPPFPAMPSSTRRAFERQFNAGQRVTKTTVSVSKPVGTDSPLTGQWIKISGTPKLHFRRPKSNWSARGTRWHQGPRAPLLCADNTRTPTDRTSAGDKPTAPIIWKTSYFRVPLGPPLNL